MRPNAAKGGQIRKNVPFARAYRLKLHGSCRKVQADGQVSDFRGILLPVLPKYNLMRYAVFLLLFFFSSPFLPAQTGCTDPQALNFDPQAAENDGSCLYPPASYTPVQIAQLPVTLEECSGLAYFADRLWTHEDGGGLDQIYVIDTLNAALLQTVTLANTDNLDWEDLAEDDDFLYIGDFGNNLGDRTDLRILRFKKSSLLAGTATPEVIQFSYSDQMDFTPAQNANDFDCEAFFFWNDSLHLFSKNWINFKTRHYVLPATPGSHIAQLRDSLEVQGQITGADITDEGKAVLLGYNVNTGETFLWLLFDFTDGHVFSGNKRKISLGSALFISQPEGITFRNETFGYICSERYSALPQKLMSFDIRQWVENPNLATGSLEAAGISLGPNPFSSFLALDFQGITKTNFRISLEQPDSPTLRIALLDSLGRPVLKKQVKNPVEQSSLRLDTTGLPPGMYWLLVRENGRIWCGKVFKQ